jgi:signal transduction histidine kinase
MLDLAQFEQMQTEAAPLLDLADAARGACATMESVAETQGVRLVIDAARDVHARLRKDHAHTLLTNLLSNAIRHSTGGATVHVVVKREAGSALLQVIDEGSGIRAEALPFVFDRFYREDPSRSRASGGTGLGLAICRSIVLAAGGHIDIASAVGEGTRVTSRFTSVE